MPRKSSWSTFLKPNQRKKGSLMAQISRSWDNNNFLGLVGKYWHNLYIIHWIDGATRIVIQHWQTQFKMSTHLYDRQLTSEHLNESKKRRRKQSLSCNCVYHQTITLKKGIKIIDFMLSSAGRCKEWHQGCRFTSNFIQREWLNVHDWVELLLLQCTHDTLPKKMGRGFNFMDIQTLSQ